MSQGLVRERPKVKAGTGAARLAYLHGEGDGKRVTDPKRLAEIGGICVRTVQNFLPEWERDFTELVTGGRGNGLRLVLSSDDIRTHKANVQNFKDLDAQIQQEIELLPKAEKHLRGLIDWFKDNGTAADVGEMKVLIEQYIRVGMTRGKRLKERLDVNARWNKLTGIEDLIDAAGAREKAMQTGRAKIDLELERKEAGLTGDGGPVKPVPPMGRRYVKKDAVPAIEVKEDDGFGDDE